MKDIIEKVEIAISPVSSTCPAYPISKEGCSHLIPENHEVARSATAVEQASEGLALMKIATEYPDSIAGTSKAPFTTEFFTCFVTQPSLVSGLNDKCEPPTLTVVDESEDVDLEQNNVKQAVSIQADG